MDLKILPNDVIRYIATEFLDYEIIDDDPSQQPSQLLKSLFGRFEGESEYFLVFRHLFTRSIKSKFFRFKKGDLYPKDAYSIECRSDMFGYWHSHFLWIRDCLLTHFISQFPHLLVLKKLQFGLSYDPIKRPPKMVQDHVYKLKTLHLINSESDIYGGFTISKNIPEIQDISIRWPSDFIESNGFLDGIEKCRNITHFCVYGLKESCWTSRIVSSLFDLSHIKTLKLEHCNLALLDVDLIPLETSLVQEVVVCGHSTKTLMALLSNTNIHSLSAGCPPYSPPHSPRLTGHWDVGIDSNGRTQTAPSPLFDLVLKKQRFQNEKFDYVAGVSLWLCPPNDDAMDDCKAILTRGKFEHLMVFGSIQWPKEIPESVPLKKLEYVSHIINPKCIIPILADEIILNHVDCHVEENLDDFNPPPGCKKIQLNTVGRKGDEIKRLMGLVQRLMNLGIDVTVDGKDPGKIFENIEGFENHQVELESDGRQFKKRKFESE